MDFSAVGSFGSNQAPVASCITPFRTSSLTTAAARQLPRALNSLTMSPSEMLRSAASTGLMRTGSRPLIFVDRLKSP